MQGKRSLARSAACALTSLVLTVGLMPLPAYAGSSSAGSMTAMSDSADSGSDPSAYEEGQAVVVYHSSGAAKGSTGELGAQSDSDPLASAGFSVQGTWDLSAADGAAEATGAAADGALSVQSEGGSTLASGSDVRVALVDGQGKSTEDLVTSLDSLDFVECASPNYRYVVSSLDVNDTYASQEWGLSGSTTGAIGGSTYGIDEQVALNAEESSGTSRNVVAVLDSGVDYTNPDLAKVMWTNTGGLVDGPKNSHGYNAIDNNYDPVPGDSSYAATHGTHCAGIIAAQANNEAGIAGAAGSNNALGTAGHTRIMAVKGSTDAGAFLTSSVAAGYEYIVKAKLAGVNVVAVNDSWGAAGGKDVYDPVLDYLVNQAGKAGVLSCFAAGNDNVDVGQNYKTATIESPYLIGVASSNQENRLSTFTCYNATGVDVAAPGSKIVSTVANNSGQFWMSALRSHDAGKNLDYYTDIAKLYTESKKSGYTGDFKVSLIDTSTNTPLDQSYFSVGTENVTNELASNQPCLKITVDYATLTADGHEAKNVSAHVSWTDKNPFKGTSGLSASDYMTNVSCFSDGTSRDATFFASISLKTSAATMADTGEIIMERCDASTIFKSGALSSIDTTSGTMTVTVSLDNGGTVTDGSQTMLVTGLGVGRCTDPVTDPSSSAFVPYASMTGTSMATPMLAGCVAELAALYPNDTPLQLRGLVCGGTEALATADDQAKVASGGRFTFADALDDSKVNANTWSITTSGTSVTVHGYNLQKASLYVDGSATAVLPTSQTAGAITFTADKSLLDGQTHRFDVTDGTTGRTYKASYVTPDSSADSLARLGDLPTAANADVGQLVSATDRLFYADGRGTFLYSSAAPSDPAGAWTQLAAPGSPWTGAATRNRFPGISYAYSNGKVYAVATDDAPATSGTAEQAVVLSDVYTIADGTWSGWSEAGRVDSTVVAKIRATTCDGSVCYLLVSQATTPTNTLFTCKAQGTSFTKETVSPATFSDEVVGVGSKAYGLATLPSKSVSGAQTLGLGILDISTMKPDEEYFAGSGYTPSTDAYLNASEVARHLAAVGGGFVVAGISDTTLGDMQLVGTDYSVTKLGSFGLSSADGLTVGSMAMYGGKLYLNCVDHATENTNSTGLYTLPAAVASRLATTDVTLAAAARTGGTATVADWRGEAAGTLDVRGGDTATWTATADAGYAFAGWYDADGNKVSPDATYSAPATAAATLTARFTAIPATTSAVTPATPAAAASDASSASPATSTPSTGDPAPSWPVALALAAFGAVCLAAATRRRAR
jgi:uncharacterized repeat protein (TIGR02543 family)